MKLTIITREGRQEFELRGSPIIVCVEDKKYILTEKGNFHRVFSKDKKGVISLLEGWSVGERSEGK